MREEAVPINIWMRASWLNTWGFWMLWSLESGIL
jgi:hypothetical protein